MPKSLINLDVDLLRTFVTIAQVGNFTRAAERLLRQQSTISLQIKRLEDALGQRLLDRTPRSVCLTPEGEAVLRYAQKILDLNDEVVSLVARAADARQHPAGHARRLRDAPDEQYPVAVRAGLSVRGPGSDLRSDAQPSCGFPGGSFDIVLVKREQGAGAHGVRVWREPLVWVSGHHDFIASDGPLPLVVSPEPCVYRKRAITALNRARVRWRVSYTCASLAGTLGAVRAGLGVAVLPREMVPHGLHITDGDPLPYLKDTEIALMTARVLDPAGHQAARSHRPVPG